MFNKIDKKGKIDLLLFLKGILKNGAIKEKEILEIRRKTYEKKKNKKWQMLMEEGLDLLLKKGKKFEEILYDLGIFNLEEMEIYKTAKNKSEAIDMILNQNKAGNSIIKFFTYLYLLPLASISILYFSFPFIKTWNHKTFDPMAKQINKTITYPYMFDNYTPFTIGFFTILGIT